MVVLNSVPRRSLLGSRTNVLKGKLQYYPAYNLFTSIKCPCESCCIRGLLLVRGVYNCYSGESRTPGDAITSLCSSATVANTYRMSETCDSAKQIRQNTPRSQSPQFYTYPFKTPKQNFNGFYLPFLRLIKQLSRGYPQLLWKTSPPPGHLTATTGTSVVGFASSLRYPSAIFLSFPCFSVCVQACLKSCAAQC